MEPIWLLKLIIGYHWWLGVPHLAPEQAGALAVQVRGLSLLTKPGILPANAHKHPFYRLKK